MYNLPGREKVVWSSEDNSGISGNWRGGGCWGRSLLQNYVKVNATSTISWATIWAAYDPWMYLGSGVGPRAWEPWSGNYTLQVRFSRLPLLVFCVVEPLRSRNVVKSLALPELKCSSVITSRVHLLLL